MSAHCRTKRVGHGQGAGPSYFTVVGSGQDESPAAKSSSIAGRAAEQTGGVRRGGSDLAGKPRGAGSHEDVGGEAGEEHPAARPPPGPRGPDRPPRNPRPPAPRGAQKPRAGPPARHPLEIV